MQKIFNNCYEMDKRCYDKYGLSEDILMEHASNAMNEYIKKHFKKGMSILIVCGIGNNGADGIALARLLYGQYKVKLFIPFELKSDMAKLQLKRASLIGIKVVTEIKEADIIVDALFGAGLKRELDTKSIFIIERLNSMSGFKIACDIPSGIDAKGNPNPIAFRADVTITMGALKEALYGDNAKDYIGEIICADLGVTRELYEMSSDSFVLEKSDIHLPFRTKQNSHKGDFGHLAVIAGEKSGASKLCGLSALRFGAGLVSVVGSMNESKIVLMYPKTIPSNTTAIAFGMGFGEDFDIPIVDKILHSTLPIVLDADVFHSKKIMEFLAQSEREIVLTPHPKEFASLWKFTMNEALSISFIQNNRFELARKFTSQYPNVTLLLKGANMIIAHQNKLFINPFGNSNLSKGGSGDVLSGLIGSLLAQGKNALHSTINGSLALSLASERFSGASYAMLPTDLIEEIEKLKL
ncbi:MAG: carbohydrate kinase [Sulfurovum sp. AS07-7]|nr:MAG: carbohydrate kinase [Sulfurovum sp. AS07-7]